MRKLILFICLIILLPQKTQAWGFYSHQLINRMAVFTLPPEMLGFYKYYIQYISENAVNPDNRRYVVKDEAPKHYIDIDVYDRIFNDSAIYKMPRYWSQALKIFPEDTLMAYGIVPWHIEKMHYQLTEAFKQKDVKRILRVSADLGHYIADANVPLHTTENYNGQLTNQLGIHAFWESRLPELFAKDYDFFIGQAQYIDNTQMRAWQAVTIAHQALDSVLKFEKILTEKLSADKKYTIEERNRLMVRTYSKEFAQNYHQMLNGQVMRQMRAAIKMIGDFWFTCWVEAGQPDLNNLLNDKYLQDLEKDLEKEKIEWINPNLKPRTEGGLGWYEKDLDKSNSSPMLYYWAIYQRKLKKSKSQYFLTY